MQILYVWMLFWMKVHKTKSAAFQSTWYTEIFFDDVIWLFPLPLQFFRVCMYIIVLIIHENT
jgi:hypothetical protein